MNTHIEHYSIMIFNVSGAEAAAVPVLREASQRLWSAFRPATLATYRRMFRDFLGFLVVAGLSWLQLSTPVLLAFMEYLHVSGMSASNIANYITAIRSLMILYVVNTDCLRDQRIPFFIKAIKINRPIQAHLPPTLDQVSLLKIVTVAEALPFSTVYVPLYLLAFFSFLRIFNILPHSPLQFDPSRNLCKGDLIF